MNSLAARCSRLNRVVQVSPVHIAYRDMASNETQRNRLEYEKSHFDGEIVSSEQRKYFFTNGYLLIRRLIDKSLLERYTRRFQQVCRREIIVPGLVIAKDILQKDVPGSESVVNKIQFFQNDDVLFEFCRLPEITRVVTSFLGANLISVRTNYFNKPPDAGQLTSRHPMHQDLHYFAYRPAEKLIGVWTAIDEASRENGCLTVYPGSHQWGYLEHGYPDWECPVNKLYHGIKSFEPSMERVYILMKPGDTLFFHPLLVHGSGANRSQGFRKSISCHYVASDVDVIDESQSPSLAQVSEEYREMIQEKNAAAAPWSFVAWLKSHAKVAAGKGWDE